MRHFGMLHLVKLYPMMRYPIKEERRVCRLGLHRGQGKWISQESLRNGKRVSLSNATIQYLMRRAAIDESGEIDLSTTLKAIVERHRALMNLAKESVKIRYGADLETILSCLPAYMPVHGCQFITAALYLQLNDKLPPAAGELINPIVARFQKTIMASPVPMLDSIALLDLRESLVGESGSLTRGDAASRKRRRADLKRQRRVKIEADLRELDRIMNADEAYAALRTSAKGDTHA